MKKNDIPKIKNTVGYALLKNVFSLYVVIAIVITLAHMFSEYRSAKNLVNEEMKNIKTVFIKQLTTSIWNLNNELLDDIIEGILTSPSIIGISIKINTIEGSSNFGTVDIVNKKDENFYFKQNKTIVYKKDIYSYQFDLKHEDFIRGSLLGTIVLYSDESVIYNKIKGNFLFIIANSIIKTLALWMIFLFFAKKYLTIPFLEIIKRTNNIDFHKLEEAKFKYSSYNETEFDVLKKTFNDMYKRLRISYHKINIANRKYMNLNAKLEDKVDVRTSELAQSNDKLEQSITNFKRTQGQLIESNDELEQTVDNLKQTQDKLVESEKMASLGGLVAGVAHEINTPVGLGLTGITHLSELTRAIRKNYEDENMSKHEFEEYINSNSKLTQMITLNLSKTAELVKSFKEIAVDQTSERKRNFNIKEYLDEVVFSLYNILKTTKIKVLITSKENISITSYPGAFSQVISNLIINSVRHGFEHEKKGNINIDITKINNNLQIQYIDNGKGIKKENLPKIFNPFFTTNREGGGTGLGLNIIYNIVSNNLNGTITCESIEGEGVLFNIILPYKV